MDSTANKAEEEQFEGVDLRLRHRRAGGRERGGEAMGGVVEGGFWCWAERRESVAYQHLWPIMAPSTNCHSTGPPLGTRSE